MADIVQEEDKKSETVQEANEASVKVEIKCDSIFVDALKLIDCIYKGIKIVIKWFFRVLGLIFRLVIGYPLVLIFVFASSFFVATWVWFKHTFYRFVGKTYPVSSLKAIKASVESNSKPEENPEEK